MSHLSVYCSLSHFPALVSFLWIIFIYGTFGDVLILGTSPALLDSLLRRHNCTVSGLLHLLASLYLLMPLSFICFHRSLSFTWGIWFSDISILCLAIFNLLPVCFLNIFSEHRICLTLICCFCHFLFELFYWIHIFIKKVWNTVRYFLLFEFYIFSD